MAPVRWVRRRTPASGRSRSGSPYRSSRISTRFLGGDGWALTTRARLSDTDIADSHPRSAPAAVAPSMFSVRVCFQVVFEAGPDGSFLPPPYVGDQWADRLEDATGLQVPGPFHPGSFGNRLEGGPAMHVHRGRVCGGREGVWAVVVGDLDDHVDGSAHAGGLGVEAGADADRSVRDLFGVVHPRVVPGFPARVGDDVEYLLEWSVDDDLTVNVNHLAPVCVRASLGGWPCGLS